MTKRPTKAELLEAAATLRRVLEEFPADEDTPRDAAVRRRAEGAIIGTELAAGVEAG